MFKHRKWQREMVGTDLPLFSLAEFRFVEITCQRRNNISCWNGSNSSRRLLTHGCQPVLQRRMTPWRIPRVRAQPRKPRCACFSQAFLKSQTAKLPCYRLVFSTAFWTGQYVLFAICCCCCKCQPGHVLNYWASKRRSFHCSLIICVGPTSIQVREETCWQSTS